MNQEEQKQKLEQDIIEVAVPNYYKYVDDTKGVRSEKDAKMFYYAFRLGIIRGIHFASTQIANYNEQLDKEVNDTRSQSKKTS
jgi:hypothetical protein